MIRNIVSKSFSCYFVGEWKQCHFSIELLNCFYLNIELDSWHNHSTFEIFQLHLVARVLEVKGNVNDADMYKLGILVECHLFSICISTKKKQKSAIKYRRKLSYTFAVWWNLFHCILYTFLLSYCMYIVIC